MKAIITGMNGAVAPYVYEALQKQGLELVIWDRTRIPTDDEAAIRQFIAETKPDLFFQIATGPVEWLSHIVKVTEELGIKLIFTSTVSVFSEQGTGPYTIESQPDAEEDYGRYKRECEQIILNHHSNAVILRLGWQIGSKPGANHMFDFLVRSHEEKGFIEASSKWYPSTSFLEDTAKVVGQDALQYEPGIYLVNANPSFSFYEIVVRLKDLHEMDWQVKEITSFVRDDRMFDDRVQIPALFTRSSVS
ncbi:sugar nucleotide-binding protein [Marinicrinis sediminis]|uniref:dTDP-4-dehydrorhamnose reductase n=1 Tax=Marinicrinis sediminis TaxID=1652465 RepID=A0ABW5RFP4_9BACL